MLVETADAAAVAMRITRAEWAALREAHSAPPSTMRSRRTGSRPGQV